MAFVFMITYMQNFTLKLQFKITGIGSASGIVYKDNLVFIISDNSSFLYQYDLEEKKLTKIKLFENSQENIPKKDKYDFESIYLKGNKLYILGSGSTSKREKRISYDLETKEIKEKDITKLYQKLKSSTSISDDDLNIEGSLFYNEKWYLFQRGNGANSKNGIFSIANFSKKEDTEPSFQSLQLPKIKHIETSFTDAILVEDKIYFLATAEDTTSTYDDGEILGSILGRIDIQSMQIDFTLIISETHKFEGLTLYNKSKEKIEFLLCEDNDTEELQSSIYKLTL
jgi:hypothetical protein